MSKFYSRTTEGFYDSDIHGKKMPADALPITDVQHAALLQVQSSGKMITSDAKGNPVASDPLPPTAAQIQLQVVIQAQVALSKSDTTILRCVERGIQVPSHWIEYRTELRGIISDPVGITSLPGVPAYPVGT